MAKKLKISLEDNNKEYQVFGINTVLKDYQLCFLINDFFEIETHLLETSSFKEEFSVFGDVIDELKVVLVQNKCTNTESVFPKLKSFEYLVIVNNSNTDVADIVKTFESNDEILYISMIDKKHLGIKEIALSYQLLGML